MNKKRAVFLWITSIVLFSFMHSMAYAELSETAQQALAQLRLLQQHMTTQSEPNNAQTSAAGPLSSSGTPTTPMAQPTTPTGAVPSGVRPAVLATALTLPPTSPSSTATQVNANNPPSPQKSNTDEAVVQDSDKDLINSKAFDGVTRQMFPLTPEQILFLKQTYHTSEFAESSPVGIPPRPTATSQFVNLSPGSTPPVIRLSQGFVSSLVFLDSTGAPWPINAYDLGDSTAFNIQWDKTGNTLMIQALKLYNYGNLAVRLRGLNTPVMLTLVPGQKAVDYRVDLRVQGYGPNAKSLPTEEGLPPSANDILLHVLDGVPPPGSHRLTVSGGDAKAWSINEKMYVRTDLTILSPGWIGSMTSADGMHAYEMQKSPVLLVSWHGKVMQLKVEGL